MSITSKSPITPFLSVFNTFILTSMKQIIRIGEGKMTTKAESVSSAIICTSKGVSWVILKRNIKDNMSQSVIS